METRGLIDFVFLVNYFIVWKRKDTTTEYDCDVGPNPIIFIDASSPHFMKTYGVRESVEWKT